MNTYLSPADQKELEQLKAEAESRGLNTEEAIEQTRIRWPFDSQGFITKRDGTIYEPSESQGGFIDSPALFSAFIGSRGSGKSGIGIRSLENLKTKTDKKMYALGFKKGSLPKWITQIEDIELVQNNSFLLIDESGINFSSRNSMSNINKLFSKMLM